MYTEYFIQWSEFHFSHLRCYVSSILIVLALNLIVTWLHKRTVTIKPNYSVQKKKRRQKYLILQLIIGIHVLNAKCVITK